MWQPYSTPDEESLFALCRALYREDPSPEPTPENNISQTTRALTQNPTRGKIVMLKINRISVGYAILISFWSNELGGEICIVDELYVRQENRGQGWATQLFELLSDPEKARKQGLLEAAAVALALEVTPSNHLAQKWYAKLGFFPAKNHHLRMRLPAVR